MHFLDGSLTCALYPRIAEEIQTKVIKWREGNAISRLLHTKSDRELAVNWKSGLARILHAFNVRSDTHV